MYVAIIITYPMKAQEDVVNTITKSNRTIPLMAYVVTCIIIFNN